MYRSILLCVDFVSLFSYIITGRSSDVPTRVRIRREDLAGLADRAKALITMLNSLNSTACGIGTCAVPSLQLL